MTAKFLLSPKEDEFEPKSRFSERDVRKKFKHIMGEQVFWAEAAPGGTAGLTDCFVNYQDLALPVELKIAKFTNLKKSLKMVVRPAQRRFHNQAIKNKMKTVFVVGVESGDILALYMFAYINCPVDVLFENKDINHWYHIKNKTSFFSHLDNPDFWRKTP